MSTYCMLGKYSVNALEGVSTKRTKEAEHLVARFQGTIRDMFVLLGEYDIVIIVDLPGNEEAMKVSNGLTKLTGITFMTMPAISATDFDIASQVED